MLVEMISFFGKAETNGTDDEMQGVMMEISC